MGTSKTTTNSDHHEQHPGVQSNFMKDVNSLIGVMEEMGSPFLEIKSF